MFDSIFYNNILKPAFQTLVANKREPFGRNSFSVEIKTSKRRVQPKTNRSKTS